MNAANKTPETRILVVDDDPAVQNLLGSALVQAGFCPELQDSAEQAFSFLESDAAPLAIVDIKLPGVNGLDLCRRMRDGYGMDVIVITGYDGEYNYVDALESGAADFIVKPVNISELVLRCERVVEARHIRQTRDRSIRELRRLAVTDSLTGLYTSGHLFDQLKAEVARCRRYSHEVSMCLLDVDHFKAINDTYGHQEGDRALVHLTQTIRSVMRECDSAFRYGGEEFVLLLPETDGMSALHVAERLRSAVATNGIETLDGSMLRLEVSVGVAQWEPDEEEKYFLKRADTALYAAKQRGRNQAALAPHGTSMRT